MTEVVRDAFTGYCRIDYTISPRLSPRGREGTYSRRGIVLGGVFEGSSFCSSQKWSVRHVFKSISKSKRKGRRKSFKK